MIGLLMSFSDLRCSFFSDADGDWSITEPFESMV